MTRRSQQGFTMVEMMVVVAIIAVLVAMASVSLRPRTTAIDTGHSLRALVDEASREAVRAGPVRPDVVTATGIRARAQVIAADDGTAFYVQRLVEDPAPAVTAAWQTVASFAVPSWVHAAAYSSQLGAYTAVSRSTNWTSFAIACFPDGTCERKTVFFDSATGASVSRQSRVAVMPLSSPHVIGKWN